MALRGAVATACNVGGRHRNPSLLSVPHYLKLKFHYPPSHALHRFTAFPIYQPGGESLSLFSVFHLSNFTWFFLFVQKQQKIILIENQVLGFIFYGVLMFFLKRI